MKNSTKWALVAGVLAVGSTVAAVGINKLQNTLEDSDNKHLSNPIIQEVLTGIAYLASISAIALASNETGKALGLDMERGFALSDLKD